MDPVSALLLRYRPVPTASLHIANRRRSSWFLSDEEPKQLLPGRNLSFSVATVASLSTPRPTPSTHDRDNKRGFITSRHSSVPRPKTTALRDHRQAGEDRSNLSYGYIRKRTI
jgi:hypothetical protein